MATFQSLPGFREFYPEDFARRNHIFRLWRQTASTFGFAEYDAPVLEPLELYKAKSGDEIEAQLFSFPAQVAALAVVVARKLSE
jgi:histidyl-tRNA synthetase